MCKRWCFTSFDTAEPKFKDGCTTYYCFGRETCPKTSKMHWQGFVVFLNRQRLSSAKKFGGHSWHYEAARGTVAENIGYCSKDGVFTEVGTRPSETSEGGAQSTKRKWIDIRDNARRGDFDAIEAKVYVQHCRNLHFISDVASQRAACRSLQPGTIVGLWLVGVPGVGKSTFARRVAGLCGPASVDMGPDPTSHELGDAGDLYYSKPCTKWWDGYTDERVVILEDMDLGHKSFGHLLKVWTDIFPFMAEHKGGSRKIRPAHFIITSNYTIEEIFDGDSALIGAIKRRCKVVTVMTRDDFDTLTVERNEYVAPVKQEAITISSDEEDCQIVTDVPAVCAE